MAITISGSGITSANIADGTITTDDILASDVSSLKSGRKNLIINGGFDVWQRGTSFSGGDTYHADRTVTYMDARADSALVRSTDVPSGERFKYSCKLTTTQSHGHPFYRQRIEDFSTLVKNTKTYTISFWAKASVSMTIDSDLGDASGQTHSLTTTWTKFTNTVAVGTSYTYDAVDLQSNSTAGDIYITGVQLELGSVATDFEHRSYGEELALCQRYYWRAKSDNINERLGTGGWGTSTSGHIAVQNPVTMRVAPTLSTTTFGKALQENVAWRQITSSAGTQTGKDMNDIGYNVASSTASQGQVSWIGQTWDYSFDAEL
jgi:hypothetical protein